MAKPNFPNLASVEAIILYVITLFSIIAFGVVVDCDYYPQGYGGRYHSAVQYFVACGVMSMFLALIYVFLLLFTIKLPGDPLTCLGVTSLLVILFFIASCVWAAYNNDLSWQGVPNGCDGRNKAGVVFGFLTLAAWIAYTGWSFFGRKAAGGPASASA